MNNSQRIFKLSAFICFILIGQISFPLIAQKKTTKAGEVIRCTDPALRMQGFERHKAMIAESPYKDLEWSHIGPTNISGRCTDIAVVTPKGKNYGIYVATASGGVWKTENEGTTWTPIFESEASSSIGDIAIAPSDQNIVWVGTGEANIFRSSQCGSGIYKSEDAGKTWNHMGLADTLTIARIVIHPENPDIVYVAASGHEWTDNEERGLFKTVDGGKTWEKVLFINDRTGAIDLVMDPSNTDILYAAMWQRIRLKWNDPRVLKGYAESGIYKTTDAGKTWAPVNSGLPAPQHRGRIGIDICQSSPNVLYALVDNYEIAREVTDEDRANPYGVPSCGFIKGATVYRSNDGGTTWIQTSGLDSKMKPYMERHSGTFGWVFGQIRIDPNGPETVYILGVPLSVSSDGGKTFKQVPGMHGDHHGLWIDPENSDYLVNVNDGGIVISYDKGKSWRQFTNNLPVCQFFNIAYDMDSPFRVYGSMQDHGSFRGVVTRNESGKGFRAVEFEGAPGGEGSNQAIDPTNPNIVYWAGFYGHLFRSDLNKPGDDTYKYIMPKVFAQEPKLRGQWLAPFIISPHNPDTVYHGLQYLFRSTNRGDTWERISPDMSSNIASELGDIPYQTLFSISESPVKSGLIYGGTDDGKVHVTKDGGKTWKEIMKGLPNRKWVSRIQASAFEMSTVYMTQNGKREDDFKTYIWKSEDYGETWTDISQGVPLGPVNVIREDPFDKNVLYAGTDSGIYVSKDRGETWNVLGGNLPTVYVHDLIIHPRDNVIVIATHGRGMWALDAEPVNGGRKQRSPF
ncbi:MAG: hypothetical protein JXB23_13395 [Candidatus Aminicenantes bacterium]|nr:hypothetical protein [Candidatus Aminicenantes bacterium]